MEKIIIFIIATFLLSVSYGGKTEKDLIPFLKNPGVEISNPKKNDIPLGFSRYFSKKQGLWNKKYARSGRAGLLIQRKSDSGSAMHDVNWSRLPLDVNELYQLSFWYKTVEKETQFDILRMDCNQFYKYYPSSRIWRRATANFKGLKKNNVTILALAMEKRGCEKRQGQ